METLAYAPPLAQESAAGLRSILDRVIKARKSLRALGSEVDQWADYLAFFTLRGMDPTTRRDWEKHVGEQQDRPTFDAVSEFIGGRIRVLQASDSARPVDNRRGASTSRRGAEVPVSRQRKCLVTTTSGEGRCVECQGGHRFQECPVLLSQEPKGRLPHASFTG